MKQVNIKLSTADVQSLTAIAAEAGTTVPALIRRAALQTADAASERRLAERITASEARLYVRIDSGQKEIIQLLQTFTATLKTLIAEFRGARHDQKTK